MKIITCKTCGKPTTSKKSYCNHICQQNDPTGVVCLVCNNKFPHNRALGLHTSKNHKIDKIEYIRKYILIDKIPLCKCGCGKEIKIKHYEPYILTKYITGHNSKGKTNPRYNVPFSDETKQKMKEKALIRIQEYKQQNKILPMHSIEGIAARAKIQTDKFIEKIENKYNVKVLNHLRESRTEIFYQVECNKCNEIFEQYHQGYFRCFKCFPRERSTYERELLEYIQRLDNNIKIIHNSRQVLSNNKELDFYFPDYNLAIEIDGLYFHSEFSGNKSSFYHVEKTKECEKLGIQLLHIFEDEWIMKRDIILSKIAQKLKKFVGTKIFARKCIVKNLSTSTIIVNDFLNLYHLQNRDISSIKYGLYYNDELISIMTFSKPNASRGHNKLAEGTYELSRYAVKHDILCIGGASKLLTAFEKEHAPKELISYADRRYSHKINTVYDKLGFIFEKETAPSYWYFRNNDLRRLHRFNFTKKKTIELGGNPDKTEWENMIEFGYDRIWDCGTLRYRKIYK